MPETNARIKVCHDTAANFKTNNPTLLVGEWALETDTKRMKIGDGTTAYNALPYSTAEDSDEWQKPSDWMDIRSGALPDSVYYLVAHSADYSTYPTFEVYATFSNSSKTYDVFVDGVKQASAVASGTVTTLNWQTLALTSGYDVTYPATLRTHIVRIAPTVSTDTFKLIGPSSATPAINHSGLLWIHSTLTYAIQAYRMGHNAEILEAVTSENDTLKVSVLSAAFANSSALKEVPILEGDSTTMAMSSAFTGASSLKKITFKNTAGGGANCFRDCTALKNIVCDNSKITVADRCFENCGNLKALPLINASSASITDILKNCTSLSPTLLDWSTFDNITKITFGGASNARIDGLKGLLVSNEAPFDGSSPQINVSYTGLDRGALVNLFNSMPTVTGSQVCNVTGATGAADLTLEEINIAVNKGWTVTR